MGRKQYCWPDIKIAADKAESALDALMAHNGGMPTFSKDDHVCASDQLRDFLADAWRMESEVSDGSERFQHHAADVNDVWINNCDEDSNVYEYKALMLLLAPFARSGSRMVCQDWEDIPATNWRWIISQGVLLEQNQLEAWDDPVVITSAAD